MNGSSNTYAHTAIGNIATFIRWADDGTNGYEFGYPMEPPRRTGTEMVENMDGQGTRISVYERIVGINNGVYFMADDGTNGSGIVDTLDRIRLSS